MLEIAKREAMETSSCGMLIFLFGWWMHGIREFYDLWCRARSQLGSPYGCARVKPASEIIHRIRAWRKVAGICARSELCYSLWDVLCDWSGRDLPLAR